MTGKTQEKKPKLEKHIKVIRPDGSDFILPQKPTYPELQTLIAGSTIERTKVQYEGRRCDAIVNENGIAEGKAFNERATALYREDWKKSYPLANISDAALFGNVVIFYGWRF